MIKKNLFSYNLHVATFLRKTLTIFRRPFSSYEKKLYAWVTAQLGYTPRQLSLYVKAMTHRSCVDNRAVEQPQNNERLEFLGDAVLGYIVAELLYINYPDATEGELSLIRDKIVNKAQLAQFASHIGLDKILRHQGVSLSQAMLCDAMEAFLAAICLDQGFAACRKYMCDRLFVAPHFSLSALAQKSFNYKGQVVEWAQRRKSKFEFKSSATKEATFCAKFYIDEEIVGEGKGRSKKEAEQRAAKRACEKLQIE